MSIVVKAGKTAKKLLKKAGLINNEHRVGYTRRIERIRTDKRICAMTFDDGPMNMPASPDRAEGRAMTDLILDALLKYNAHATFDIVGTTEHNYPDKVGKTGTASWGGVKFDHYPDIGKDMLGGAVHAPHIVKRMLNEGHELANHGYRHIIFGKKPFVYGAREHFESIDEVCDDLSKLHDYIKNNFDYEIKLSRPPHYVDKISGGFTSYDAYSFMDYGYMAASFDGGGWLPDINTNENIAADREIEAMGNVIKNALDADPDALCGQIIFGKDGYNMAKRTPVAYALEKQLEILTSYGYTVMSVSEMMKESPFADVGRECAYLDKLIKLSQTNAVAYTDNTLRLQNKMTYYEYAMLVCPKEIAVNKRIEKIKLTGKFVSEYDTALEYAKSEKYISMGVKGSDILTEFTLDEDTYNNEDGYTRGEVFEKYYNIYVKEEIKA